MSMTIGEWLTLILACGAAILGLFLAASNNQGAIYTIGLGLFIAAVAYALFFLKRHFDSLDQARH